MATCEVVSESKGANLKHVKDWSIGMYTSYFRSISSTFGSLKRQKSCTGDLSAPLNFTLSFLANPPEESAFDVGIDTNTFCVQPTEFPEAYSFSLNRTLNPNKANLFPTLFIDCAWSPSNILSNGSSLLATLSSNNRIYLSKEELFTGCSDIILDVSKTLFENYKGTDFTDPVTKLFYMEAANLESLSKQFLEYRRRQNYLAITGIDWCPLLDPHAYKGVNSLENQDEGALSRLTISLLCGCNKLGMVFIWQVIVDMLNDNVSSNLVGRFHLLNECATNVAWYQHEQSTKGCIAVSFSNGFIKLFAIDIATTKKNDVTVNELQQYDLWTEEDLIHITSMEWLKRDNNVHLVVIKDANILLFTINFGEDQQVDSHSYKLPPCTHEHPISALCCRGDYIVTTSCNGFTEFFSIGDKNATVIKNHCKPGYSCFGMQISADGWLLIRLISPTNIFYRLGKKCLESELVINPFLSFEDAAQLIADSHTPPGVEMYEYCRVLASYVGFPKLLENFAASPIDKTLSPIQLQKKLFVNWLENERKENLKEPLSKEMYMQLLFNQRARRILRHAKDYLKTFQGLGDKSKKLLLLAADWLVIKSDNEAYFELAILVYELAGDAPSVDRARAIWAKRFASGTPNDASALERTRNSVHLPSRETCPVCKGDIFLENEQFGNCEKGHRWSRCICTFFIISQERLRTCCNCGRVASAKEITQGKPVSLYHKQINTNKCPICNSLLLGT
eukprot:gene9615-17374_t